MLSSSIHDFPIADADVVTVPPVRVVISSPFTIRASTPSARLVVKVGARTYPIVFLWVNIKFNIWAHFPLMTGFSSLAMLLIDVDLDLDWFLDMQLCREECCESLE